MDISSTDRKLSLNFRFLHGYCGAISLTDLSEWTSWRLLTSGSSRPNEWRYGAGAEADSGAGSGGSGLISFLFCSGLSFSFHLSAGMKGSGGGSSAI